MVVNGPFGRTLLPVQVRESLSHLLLHPGEVLLVDIRRYLPHQRGTDRCGDLWGRSLASNGCLSVEETEKKRYIQYIIQLLLNTQLVYYGVLRIVDCKLFDVIANAASDFSAATGFDITKYDVFITKFILFMF